LFSDFVLDILNIIVEYKIYFDDFEGFVKKSQILIQKMEKELENDEIISFPSLDFYQEATNACDSE